MSNAKEHKAWKPHEDHNYYSNLDLRALVLHYMPNGSLEKRLYNRWQKQFGYCTMRINIMINVATRMEYLHNGYSMPIVHHDLKPSNILLDENMVIVMTCFQKIFEI